MHSNNMLNERMNTEVLCFAFVMQSICYGVSICFNGTTFESWMESSYNLSTQER